MVERAVDNRKTGVQFSVPLPKGENMKNMIFGALALALTAGAASAADFSATVGYQDRGTYTSSVSVSAPVGPVVGDLTGVFEANDKWNKTQRVEVGGTLFNERFAVRAAVGEYFGGHEFSYYSVTPSVQFDVPYTDKFVVSARYRNAFDADGYETYGVGARASWNTGPVVLSAGAAVYTGDADYAEYTVGVSRGF